MDDADEYPHRDLRRGVQRAPSTNESAALLDVAGLQVFEYRVMSEEDWELWHPLEERLLQFQKRHEGNIRVWRELSSHPDRATIKKWLLAQVSMNDECEE